MADHNVLAHRFEEHRVHLRSMAYHMLGSTSDADDAVQETWLRLSRVDAAGIKNMRGWLTTVIGRVCLDALRARKARREEPAGIAPDCLSPALVAGRANHDDPEQQALVADAVGPALLVVLDLLSPAERVAFVLHDVFEVPFDLIASFVDRSPDAAKMLASRARRKVRGASTPLEPDQIVKRDLVSAFLAASRDGHFHLLLEMLDPEVVLRADNAAIQMGSPAEIRGARDLAEFFSGRAQAARMALVDGVVNAMWAPGGNPRVIFAFTIEHGLIIRIELLAEPTWIRQLDVLPLGL